MSDRLLTPEELFRYTKKKRFAAQRRALERLGIAYRAAPDGEPLVWRSTVDDEGKPAHRPPSGPRWDRIGSVRQVRLRRVA